MVNCKHNIYLGEGGIYNAKKIFLCWTILLIAFLAACQSNHTNGGDLDVLPLSDQLKETDLIAEIKVIKMVAEADKPTPASVFEVQITDVLKGDQELLHDDILIKQGNHEWQFDDSHNDNYILFLKEALDADGYDFWILGEEAGMYRVFNEKTIVKLAYDDDALKTAETTEAIREEALTHLNIDTDSSAQVLDKQKLSKSFKNK